MNISEKSRTATFLLAFFLGAFGIHRFYVGKVGSALAMLFLTLSFVGILVTGFWTLIDCITIVSGNFRDAEGKLITNW